MKFFGQTLSSATAAPSVQFVPGDFFFMRRFDLPAGTAPSELAGFVELRLEELSPFPLDQLHHGYLRASDDSAVFVYAAYRRRLPAGQAETWAQALFVLPDFAPALKLRFAASTVVLLRSATALAALYFEADRELPVRSAARALPAEASESDYAAVRRAVLDLVEAGSAHEEAIDLGPPPQQRAQGLTFSLVGAGRSEPRELVLSTAECWTMDVREPEFVADQRRRLRVDLLFWRVVQGAVAAMLLLLLGEFLLLAGSGYTSWLERRWNDRQPEVTALDGKNSLAIGLDNFRGRAVEPFEMFKVLNRGRNQDAVWFTEARLDGLKMEVRGEALNMAEYNAYIAVLRTAQELAGPPGEGSPKVQNNITTFSFVVNFKPGVFAVAQQAPTP